MCSLSIEVVLWDWNGTLLDDGAFGLQIINGLLEERGMRIPSKEEHGQLFDFPVIRYYERLGFDFTKEPFEVVSQQFIDAYYAGVESCPLRPGSRAVLDSLREAGYRQTILSASKQEHLEGLIAHFGLEEYFEELLGIDSVHAPGKTARGCGWIEKTGIDPQKVVLIGDTLHDAEVADRMGIHGLLLDGGHHPATRLREAGKPILSDIRELPEMLSCGLKILSA